MKVLAFATSNSLTSINKQLVQYATSLFNDANVQVEIIDLNDFEMDIYRPDREDQNGIPKKAIAFYDKITAADALIISFAEYNGSYTAAYKNIFDWASRIDMKLYQNKPTMVMGASPGPRGAMKVLQFTQEIAPFFAMDIKSCISIPEFHQHFNFETGQMISEKYITEISNALTQLV